MSRDGQQVAAPRGGPKTPDPSPQHLGPAPSTGGATHRREALLRRFARHPAKILAVLYPGALLAGFVLTRVGTSTWDTPAHRAYMLWLVGKWHGRDLPVPFETIKWYGPLWEYVLAFFDAALRFLGDPLWVRHSVTFTLLPLTLVGTYVLLRRAGETPGTACLACALLASNIRFLGHSILNVKDFPFACGYLLCTLLMWIVLREKLATPAGLLSRPGWLLMLTALSVLPYLLRAPVFSHWLLLCGMCLYVALRAPRGLSGERRWPWAFLPLLAGPFIVWSLWPTLWEAGIRGFGQSFGLFSRFTWVGRVRAFGWNYSATELPWWYGPAWIPVSWEPIGLVLLAVGALGFLLVVAHDFHHYRARPVGLLLHSLPVWVAIFAVSPWAAVLVLRPVLYDEERHLLFAMPLLAVSAALGLRRLADPMKLALAGLVLVSVLQSVTVWGKYAYVYKNPLLPHSESEDEDFMGDYWVVASGAMAQALYDRVPNGAYVVVVAPLDPLMVELERRERSLLLHAQAGKSFRLEDKGPPSGDFYVLATNRNGMSRRILEDIRAGTAREIWSEKMPPGDRSAAVLAYYTEPCGHCRMKVRLL